MTTSDQRFGPGVALAKGLFADLARLTAEPDGAGVRRDSYGEGEQIAHDLVAESGRALGLAVARDAALNLYLTWPGTDPALPAIMIGSHLDSVMHGGNYDGAAGVLAGLAAIADLMDHGRRPARDTVVMAIRAEESVWFDAPYIGSRLAFGAFDPADLDRVSRSDTGRPLASHMATAGADVGPLRSRTPALDPRRIAAFIEPHIEQGPVLAGSGLPLGVVTGVYGCARLSSAGCRGTYAHSGATPHPQRQDAVLATAELVVGLEEARVAAGGELRVTVGVLSTDPAVAAGSKIAGETRFVVDIRGLERAAMQDMIESAERIAARIEGRRGVEFQLGQPTWSAPSMMSAPIVSRLEAAALRAAKQTTRVVSGAGHDSVVFAEQGIPAAMLFIRNTHGSHNPREHMELTDFADAVAVLSEALATWGGAP